MKFLSVSLLCCTHTLARMNEHYPTGLSGQVSQCYAGELPVSRGELIYDSSHFPVTLRSCFIQHMDNPPYLNNTRHYAYSYLK